MLRLAAICKAMLRIVPTRAGSVLYNFQVRSQQGIYFPAAQDPSAQPLLPGTGIARLKLKWFLVKPDQRFLIDVLQITAFRDLVVKIFLREHRAAGNDQLDVTFLRYRWTRLHAGGNQRSYCNGLQCSGAVLNHYQAQHCSAGRGCLTVGAFFEIAPTTMTQKLFRGSVNFIRILLFS